jgi:hypothetical protein
LANEFKVEVLAFSVLKEIAGVWTVRDFSALLAAMEFGSIEGMTDDELRDMCILSLQDLEPEAAAGVLLKYRIGSRLSQGQIENIAADMPDEKLWEEYADMALHEQLFNVASLLYMAFPRTFSEPDAVRVRVKIVASSETGRTVLQDWLNESFLVRLLAAGMEEDAALNRLFERQLKGDTFPEAEWIIWVFECVEKIGDAQVVELISSGSWLDPLRTTKSYTARAFPDKVSEKIVGLNVGVDR